MAGPVMAEEYRVLADTVRRLARDRLAPQAARVDEDAAFPRHASEAMANAGLLGLPVPEADGGSGADALAVAVAVEETARACASSAMLLVSHLAGMWALLAAADDSARGWLEPLATGGQLTTLCGGADALAQGATAVTAVREGDVYVLSGTSPRVWLAGAADQYVVAAGGPGTAAPPSLLRVPGDHQGVVVGEPVRTLGLRGLPSGPVRFADARVPAECLVGPEGQGRRPVAAARDHLRLAEAAVAVGIAQGAFDEAASYVTEREQFGQTLASFQGVQFMVADMAAAIESARHLVHSVAAEADRGALDLPARSAMSRLAACDRAVWVTTDAVQLLGGYGYTRDYPAERMMRDAKMLQTTDPEASQRAVVARELLDPS